jgi:hypothetical protein
MPSPILARADALMQRRRQNAEADDVPVLTDAVDFNAPETDDDVPVLFDIEPIAPLSSTADAFLPDDEAAQPQLPEILIEEPPLPELIEVVATDPAPDASLPAAAVSEEIAREIARRVEQRLAAELPRIIEATVRDFLAEQARNTQEANFRG